MMMFEEEDVDIWRISNFYGMLLSLSHKVFTKILI